MNKKISDMLLVFQTEGARFNLKKGEHPEIKPKGCLT